MAEPGIARPQDFQHPYRDLLTKPLLSTSEGILFRTFAITNAIK